MDSARVCGLDSRRDEHGWVAFEREATTLVRLSEDDCQALRSTLPWWCRVGRKDNGCDRE